MDIFDIGQDLGYIGQVKAVKILGALAVNDVSHLHKLIRSISQRSIGR